MFTLTLFKLIAMSEGSNWLLVLLLIAMVFDFAIACLAINKFYDYKDLKHMRETTVKRSIHTPSKGCTTDE